MKHSPAPWRYDGKAYIWDARGKMVAQVRGWARLGNQLGAEKAIEAQSEIGEMLALTPTMLSVTVQLKAELAEVTALLKDCVEYCDEIGVFYHDEQYQRARAFLAKRKPEPCGTCGDTREVPSGFTLGHRRLANDCPDCTEVG